MVWFVEEVFFRTESKPNKGIDFLCDRRSTFQKDVLKQMIQ